MRRLNIILKALAIRLLLSWKMYGFEKKKAKALKMTQDQNKTYTVIRINGKWRILNNIQIRKYKKKLGIFQNDVNFNKLKDLGYYVTR